MLFVSALGVPAAAATTLLQPPLPTPPAVPLRTRVAPLADRRIGLIHHGSTASSAVAQRLGFTRLREDMVLGRPCTVYALARDAFASP